MKRKEHRDEFTDEFHRLLGRLVRASAHFDFAIGLQLRWLGPHLAVEIEHLLGKRVPMAQRLAALRPLVLDLYAPAGPGARAQFEEWFARAGQLKSLRNDYVHGRWGVPAKRVDGKLLLGFVPLHWDMRSDRADDSVHMSLEDFAVQVDSAVGLFDEYLKLEKVFGHSTRPRVESKALGPR